MPGRPSPDRTVGHHVLIRELGRGGMGTVYLARDARLDRQVAIKFVSVAGPAATQRFIAEARVTARCKHSNIVDIYEIDDDDGQPYMVLEYVEGESAQALVARGPLDPERAVAILTQVARGLAFAHSRGVIHRDLKPANILVTAGGVAKIVDFGIAKPFDDDSGGGGDGDGLAEPPRDLTGSSELPGTLHYIAPEQARRDPCDDRVDLWAFGVTLYQLLCGRCPLDGRSSREVLAHVTDLDREVPRLDAVAPHLPPALVELTHRCLEKRLELRMASAAELVVALEAIAPPRAEVEAIAPPPVAADRRGRIGIAAIVAVVVAIAIVAVAIVAWPRRGSRPPPPPSSPSVVAVDPDAALRAQALVAELDRLDRLGAVADGDQLLAHFLGDEPDPHAVALAWLARGDRERSRAGAGRDAAMTSYATAYARAADPAVQRRALLAVTRIYLERWDWDRMAAVLEVLDELAGPGDADADADALRDQLRLAVRDRTAAAPGSPADRIGRALLVGRAVALPLTYAHTVDVDGDGDLDLVAIEGDQLVARTADTLTELSRRPLGDLTELGCAGRDDRGAYVVAARSRNRLAHQLVPLDGGPMLPLDRFAPRNQGRCRWIDLDGRHGDELYLFANEALVRVVRGADGGWRHDVMPTGSEVWDAIGGDLDGDGRRELVVSIGEWRGYEVRLLRADPDGTLRVHDRVRLGLVGALADLGPDGRGGARLAALKLDVYPNVRDLPADRPLGAPAGLYVLGLAGDRLTVVRHVELPGVSGEASHRLASRHFPEVWPVRVADVDGDGQRDVIARIGLAPERPNLLVMLGAADGDFAVRVVSGLDAQAVIDTDGDAADELVARLPGEAGAWILGGGATAIPPRAVAKVARPPASPADDLDPSIAAARRRAEQLARIGQVEAAADALQRVATLTGSPAVKADTLRRVATLLTAAGLPAAATFEAIAQLPAATDRDRVDAWLAAIDDDLAHVALIDARDRIARLRASALALTVDDTARLATLSAQVPAALRVVFGADGLDPAWRIADPSLAHVVPGARQLAIETLTRGAVATLALVAGAHGIVVTVDAEVTRMEWAGSLVVRLAPRDGGPGGIAVEIGARGGGRFYRRGYSCTGTYPSGLERYAPLPDSDEVVAVHLELAIVPGTRRARCAITADGRPMTIDLDVAPSPIGDWALSIGAGELAAMTSATARITSIAVAGAVPVAAPPSELDAAALALASHRAADARAHLARLDRRTAATWPAVRLAVIAADELGDRRAATAALAAALDGPAADRPALEQLASLARARDGQFLPVLRAGFGRRVAVLLAAAWTETAHHDLDQPRVRTALIRDLDGLPPSTPATRDPTLSLLGHLGEALLGAGRPDVARRALTDALALVPAAASPGLRDRAERIAYLLATDAAARGDEPAARRWALTSIELSNYPEVAADAVLLDAGLRALAAGPGWERVVRLGRALATAP